jgi:formylglycine-generating enzyme required for sulfatase activity
VALVDIRGTFASDTPISSPWLQVYCRTPDGWRLGLSLAGDWEKALTAAPAPIHAETIRNSAGMKLNLIPSGEFLMGSPESEAGRGDDERQHPVRITRPFYIGVYEVTQREYEAVMGVNPSAFKEGNRPVEKSLGDRRMRSAAN